MKNILSTIAIITLLAGMAGCDETKKILGANKDALYQNEWKLATVQGIVVPEDSKAALQFSPDGRVSGNAGCNSLTGSFALDGISGIKFSPLALTKMMCLDSKANEIETKFTGALSAASSWSISNGELALKGGDSSVVAVFAGIHPPTAEELKLNGTWELNYITGPKIAFNGLFPNKKPTINFNLPNAQATGNGSCNDYSAKIRVNGNKISFGEAIATQKACMGNGNGEYFYLRTLKTITSYSISDTTLTLQMGDVAMLRFGKK